MLIEFWKVTKVMNVSIDSTPGRVPRLKFENRSSYVDSHTKQWDDEATRYMMYGLFPCVICYFIYSLIYEKHKNWCAPNSPRCCTCAQPFARDGVRALCNGLTAPGWHDPPGRRACPVTACSPGFMQRLQLRARRAARPSPLCAIRRYSFILATAVGFVFAFQFVLMCPQLYLNYKLKSVAHLPWRQMTYKFLNTIVDDFGAFIIKAPFLYRLAVFRDDVVFLIYIYQRWIYRVDASRVNEFGFSDKPPDPSTATGAIGRGAGGSGGGGGAGGAAEEPAGGVGSAGGAARRRQANAQLPSTDATDAGTSKDQ
jgi:Cleft lip and palate transmembrane protein 1 (CLPTM1)